MDLQQEKELVKRAQSDHAHFGLIFERYYSDILNYALHRTGDLYSAQDIASQTFMKALANLDHFRWKKVSIAAWFYRIATNEINQYFREGARPRYSLDDLAGHGFDIEDNHEFNEEMLRAEEEIKRHRQFLHIRQELENLPTRYQEVIALRFFEGKKVREVAEILGKRDGTVKSLLSRGLDKLRKQMEDSSTQPYCDLSIEENEGGA